MITYFAGSDVTIAVDLIDRADQMIEPMAGTATWRVIGEDGTDLYNSTVEITGGESAVEVTVPAAYNTGKALRLVRVEVPTSKGTQLAEAVYKVTDGSALSIPTESGQTLLAADALASSMGRMEGWKYASQEDREEALKGAWERLARLRYNPWRPYDDVESVYGRSDYTTLSEGLFRINELTAEQWGILSTPFKTALARAQVAEADVMLGGDEVGDRRREGLLSKTVGESSEMFRPGKPAAIAVSPQAMRELKGFITFAGRVGRG